MHLNPDIADYVEIVDSQGLIPDAKSDAEGDQELLCIEPGETYQVLFKLRVKKVKMARSFMQDDAEGDPFRDLPNMGARMTTDSSGKDSEVTINE